MEVEVEESPGQKILLVEAEPNLWKIQEKREEKDEDEGLAPLPPKGLLMTYVDDRLVAAWKFNGGSSSYEKSTSHLDHF